MKTENLKNYFLEKITEEDLSEYKVLGKIKGGERNITVFKTDDKAWISEFKIALIPIATTDNCFENNTLILVSPECPEYYIMNKEEILNMMTELMEDTVTIDSEWLEKFMKDYYGRNGIDYLKNYDFNYDLSNNQTWSNPYYATTATTNNYHYSVSPTYTQAANYSTISNSTTTSKC